MRERANGMASVHSIRLGDLVIGGGAPVSVQSMTNTDTRDAEATLAQIDRLCACGCEIVRVAIPDELALFSFRKIREKTGIPLIADIHFDYRLAVGALEAGADCVRINPGNIGSREKIWRVVDAASGNGAAIRIGVNSGSISKEVLDIYGRPCAEAMVASALEHVKLFENRSFHNFKISLKSSSVLDSLQAYRQLRMACDYPLHIGITEAGTLMRGAVKSAIGLGILLHEGIGDTMRVSLTADPAEEVRVAWNILNSLGLRSRGPEIISCPTCGRTEIDLFSLAAAVEKRIERCTANIKIAVMGCVVNGPGEAREADIGLAGGRDKGIIFRKGKIIRTVRGQAELLSAFLEELDSLTANQR